MKFPFQERKLNNRNKRNGTGRKGKARGMTESNTMEQKGKYWKAK